MRTTSIRTGIGITVARARRRTPSADAQLVHHRHDAWRGPRRALRSIAPVPQVHRAAQGHLRPFEIGAAAQKDLRAGLNPRLDQPQWASGPSPGSYRMINGIDAAIRALLGHADAQRA